MHTVFLQQRLLNVVDRRLQLWDHKLLEIDDLFLEVATHDLKTSVETLDDTNCYKYLKSYAYRHLVGMLRTS